MTVLITADIRKQFTIFLPKSKDLFKFCKQSNFFSRGVLNQRYFRFVFANDYANNQILISLS